VTIRIDGQRSRRAGRPLDRSATASDRPATAARTSAFAVRRRGSGDRNGDISIAPTPTVASASFDLILAIALLVLGPKRFRGPAGRSAPVSGTSKTIIAASGGIQ
jgi:hypothetical protein